jgi:hypothetical protein
MILRRLIVLLLVVPLGNAVAGTPDCDPVFAVGDLHGGYDAFVTILSETGLVDEELSWTGGNACLVQPGDVVDRGARSREILDLLIRLQEQAPNRVFPLVGNHEIMNLLGDLRYVADGEIAAFADEETAELRAAGFEAFANGDVANGLDVAATREVFEDAYKPGWFAHRQAFSPHGVYGSWLLRQRVTIVINDTLFVHGGLAQEDAARGVERINDRVIKEVKHYYRLRDKLIEAGWLSPLTPFVESFESIHGRLAEVENDPTVRDSATIITAREFLDMSQASCVRASGPVWNRQLAREDEEEFEPALDELIYELGVSRIVVSHTPQSSHRIDSRFDGRVFVIDTGAGPAYGGVVSALEITRGGRVTAVYAGERETLVDPLKSDEAISKMLFEGVVVEREPIGTGITQPDRVVLELDGRRITAAFKDVRIQNTGPTRFESKLAEFNFQDDYRFERAAYLLDRRLGMNMVPVVVIRSLGEDKGALIQWISGNVVNEAERRAQGINSPDPTTLIRQRDVMSIFDVLVLNGDRHLSNQLIDLDAWRLHLIDHSRTFRLSKNLPKGYGDSPASLPRWLYDELQSLNQQELQLMMAGLVSRTQIRALLARRDKLIKKIDADRKQYGDAMIFHPETASD